MKNILAMMKKAAYIIKLTVNPVRMRCTDGTWVRGVNLREARIRFAEHEFATRENLISITDSDGTVHTRQNP